MKRVVLRQIVADVLEIDPELLNSDIELTTIEAFDSVNILILMLRLDEQAGIKMTPADASKLHYYGDFEQLAGRQGIILTD